MKIFPELVLGFMLITLAAAGWGYTTVMPSFIKTQVSSITIASHAVPQLTPQPLCASKLAQQPQKKLWGVFNADQNIAPLESELEKPIDLAAYFYAFEDAFPSSFGSTIRDKNKTLVIFWESSNVSLDSIIHGDSDAYILQFAADAKSYCGPIILVPFNEMNGNWNSWSGSFKSNGGEKIIQAWRHIHDLFTIAPNVKFGWSVNNTNIPNVASNTIDHYYPGDAYVDYVGTVGYNFANQSSWSDYQKIFSPVLKKLVAYKKPIYIFATASAAGPKKAPWITNTLSQIHSDPRISGFIWFNQNKEKNWLIDSDPQSLQAFKQAIQEF